MPHSTHIDGISTEELLRVIGNSRLSGVLTVVDRMRSGRIVFTWGRVIGASIEGQDRLGELLLKKSLISAKDLGVALERQASNRKPRPLGTILSSMGFVETGQIRKILREQMKHAFYELMEWDGGVVHLQLDNAASLASVQLDVSLDTHTLLLKAAQRRDEASSEKAQADLDTDSSESDLGWWPDEDPIAAEASKAPTASSEDEAGEADSDDFGDSGNRSIDDSDEEDRDRIEVTEGEPR